MLNMLVVLYTVLFSNLGLAIIVLTIIIRIITMPLTLKQLKQMRAMTDLQPRLKRFKIGTPETVPECLRRHSAYIKKRE